MNVARESARAHRLSLRGLAHQHPFSHLEHIGLHDDEGSPDVQRAGHCLNGARADRAEEMGLGVDTRSVGTGVISTPPWSVAPAVHRSEDQDRVPLA